MNTEQPHNSPYIAYYGMTRDPFDPEVNDDFYFEEPVRSQRLDTLFHLTQNSDQLILVTGPEGSGKSTLLSQFNYQASDNLTTVQIRAEGGIDERQMLQQIFRQLELDFNSPSLNDLRSQTRRYFESLLRLGHYGVLLVDDADQLPVNTLNQILKLAAPETKDSRPVIRIILFGTSRIDALFQDPQFEAYSGMGKSSLDLPPFDRKHTGLYIQHRLAVANFSTQIPFTDSDFGRIHKRSGGWPGQINELCRSNLLDGLPPSVRHGSKEFDVPSGFRPARILALIVSLAIIAGLVIYHEQVSEWLKSGVKPTTVTVSEAPVVKPAETGVMTDSAVVPRTEKPLPAPAAEATTPAGEETAPPAAEIPMVEKPVPARQVPEPAPRVTQPEAAPTVSAPAPAKPAGLPSQAATIPDEINSRLPLRRNAWLLQQDPDHYTLQLVAGHNIETIDHYIRNYELEQELALYLTQRDGETWYGLVYGVFADKPQAVEAIDDLPVELRTPSPWVRDMGGIQQTLRNPSN